MVGNGRDLAYSVDMDGNTSTGCWTGELGPCVWSLVHGSVNDDMFDQYCQHLQHVVLAIRPGLVVLDMFHDLSRPSALQRQQAAAILARAPNVKLVGGHAFVTNSVIGRGALTAINWVFRKDFPERVFSNPLAGVEWLQQQNTEVDAKALLAHINKRSRGVLETLAW